MAAFASLLLVLVIAACSAVGSPGAGGGSAPGGDGPSSSNPGDDPVSGTPGGGSGPLPGGQPRGEPMGALVFPKPGVLDSRPVPVQAMRRQPSESHVVIRLGWTSGVEPCSTLSGVAVRRDGDTFTLTVMEGSLDRTVACIEIAQLEATLVDLGELPAGTYTVVADPGFAPPLTVVVAER